MNQPQLRRRDVLASVSFGALALAACATGGTGAPAGGALAGGALDRAATATLSRAARLLYPHDAVADAVYAEVVDGIVGDADPVARDALATGARGLDGGRPGRFVQLGEAEQTAALEAIADTAFFTGLRADVQARLYEHPAVWAAIGYPGPALPFGGYRDKGFDDIDWLPDDVSEEAG